VRTGTIPSVRVGRLIRVPTSKVLEMIGASPTGETPSDPRPTASPDDSHLRRIS
jgi:hypothetical protein